MRKVWESVYEKLTACEQSYEPANTIEYLFIIFQQVKVKAKGDGWEQITENRLTFTEIHILTHEV